MSDTLRDILVTIRFYGIWLAVALVIATAHQLNSNSNPLNNREVFEALDPGLFQRAVLASSVDGSDAAPLSSVN